MIDQKSHMPLYLQVRQDLEQKMLSGEIKIGDKLQSEKEMTAHYKVGRMTIRNALSELVSKGYLKKDQGLGTFCIKIPEQVSSNTIDLLLDMKNVSFIPYFLSGINRVTKSRNCEIRVHDTADSMDTIASLLEEIMNRGTDGVIIQPYTGRDEITPGCKQALELFMKQGIPLVTIDGKFRNVDTPCVMNDDVRGGYIATQHLISMGHKNILGYFRERYKDSSFRANGYDQAMQEAELTPRHLNADTTEPEQLVAYLRDNGITAMVCYNDNLVIDCYHIFDKYGLKIGEDISIVGYDDTEFAVSVLPPFTSVTHPKDVMGETTANILLKMIEADELKYYRHVFSPSLIERASVRRLK